MAGSSQRRGNQTKRRRERKQKEDERMEEEREDKREEEEVPCERILIEAIMYSLGFEGTNASPQLGLT